MVQNQQFPCVRDDKPDNMGTSVCVRDQQNEKHEPYSAAGKTYFQNDKIHSWFVSLSSQRYRIGNPKHRWIRLLGLSSNNGSSGFVRICVHVCVYLYGCVQRINHTWLNLGRHTGKFHDAVVTAL